MSTGRNQFYYIFRFAVYKRSDTYKKDQKCNSNYTSDPDSELYQLIINNNWQDEHLYPSVTDHFPLLFFCYGGESPDRIHSKYQREYYHANACKHVKRMKRDMEKRCYKSLSVGVAELNQ